MTFPRDTQCRSSAGFTLVELLVAMVIAGLLAGIILQVITGQARTTRIQFARQEVAANTRGALELAASELRAVSSAANSILYAGADSIRFRSPIAWGVYCDTQSGRTLVRFDQAVWNAIARSVPATVGLALQTSVSPAPAVFAYSDATTRQPVATTNLGACANMGQDGATVVLPFTGVSSSSSTPPPIVGEAAYLYSLVAYGDGVPSTTSTSDRWMTREFAGQPEPLAGPVESLQFRYLNDADALLATPVADPTQIRTVRIVIAMSAQPRTGASNLPIARSLDSVTVALRNAR